MWRQVIQLLIILLLSGSAGVAEPPAPDPLVRIKTEHDHYRPKQKIRITIENHRDQPIWVSTSCGMPLMLYTVNGCELEVHGAYPTKECYAPPLRVNAHASHQEKVNLEKTYAHTFFKISPGEYQFGIQYFHTHPEIVRDLPQPMFAYSNRFVIE